VRIALAPSATHRGAKKPLQQGDPHMTVNEALRAIAGAFVLVSLALGWWVHPGFFLFTAFVGLNLFQSAFSKWCPMITILRKAGVRD
jgi:hypothetical protein